MAQIECKTMEITQEEINGVTVLYLSGRLNVTTTVDLESSFGELLKSEKSKVLVDCRDLEYISSAGLRVLLSAAKSFKKIGGEISLCSLKPNVKQVFEISGFTTIFPIFNSKEEALGQ